MSIDSNEAFEFIFKNDYPDLFNFEPGVLHFQPSLALLHLSNQFMYHMTISGNCWAFFFHSSIYLFIFSPHGGEKRWRQKMKYKLEINCNIYVFPIFRFGNWWTRHNGLKEKNEWFIRPSTDHHVLNVVAQWFNLTLAWKKGNMSRPVIVKWDNISLVSRYLALQVTLSYS